MPVAKHKPAPAVKVPPKRAKAPQELTGPDGLTFAKRLRQLMAERDIGQTELARMCSAHYSTFVPTVEDKIKQQHIYNILQGQGSSEALPLLAAVLDVNEMWLQFGIGRRERHSTRQG